VWRVNEWVGRSGKEWVSILARRDMVCICLYAPMYRVNINIDLFNAQLLAVYAKSKVSAIAEV
jgi:hypothetical protein